MRKLTLLLTLCLCLPLAAQVRLDAPRNLIDTLPRGFATRPGSFRSGEGVPVETLDINDGRLLLVLRDDHTWY